MDRIALIKAHLERSPGDSFLQHALALEHIKLGDDAEAARLFETLLQHDPGYVGSYYHWGKTLERLGDAAQAAEAYRRGLEAARAAGEARAASELQSALDELEEL